VNGNRAAVAVIVLGGAYYLTRRNPTTGRSLADDVLQGLGVGPGTARPAGYSSASPYSSGASVGSSSTPAATANRTATYAAAGASIAASTLPAILGGSAAAGGGAAAAGGSAAGAGAGIGLAGALTITGVAAGAAILAWGIIEKGWFRGGEEALKVNPARDTYLQAYNQHYGFPASDPGLGDGRGFAQACGDVGMPGFEADRLLRRLHKADTINEWKAATADATATFEQYERLKGSSVLPAWRQQQLQGAIVFANGQTVTQLVAATLALGSGYADLVADYRRGFA
jgi:hypothetical protein